MNDIKMTCDPLSEHGDPLASDRNVLLSCSHLRFGYGGNRQVLSDVNMEVHSGELSVVFGRSGSGKTTLLKCLLNYLPHDSGTVKWSASTQSTEFPPSASLMETPGENADRARNLTGLWQKISTTGGHPRTGVLHSLLYHGDAQPTIVFADCSNALPELTAEENIVLLLAPRGVEVKVQQESVKTLLEITRLTPYAHHRPAELSSGQLRRLCLAQSLASAPRVLVWDEPTLGLDLATKYEFLTFVQSMQSLLRLSGIIVTHDIETVLMIADVIHFLSEGRINCSRRVPWVGSRSPDDLDAPEYKQLRREMISFLEPKYTN